MKAVNRREFVGGALSALLLGCLARRPQTPEARLAAAADLAREQLAAGKMKGVVLGADGQTWAGGLRTFDPIETPMTVDCLFDVASITKPLVAAALARLAADGKFDPEAPFTTYLPDHVLGARCNLTSVDLATHTSGYENLEELRDGISLFAERSDFLRKCLSYSPKNPRHWKYRYCCQNYIYLGLILEAITGRPLDVACRELVFEPLGMYETGWGPLRDTCRAVQQPSAFVNTPNSIGEINDERAARCAFPIGNAGVFSTCGDLLKFAEDLARRKCFPMSYYDLLQRPAIRFGGKVRSFGFDLSPDPILRAASPRAVRHSGFTGQTIFADPETGRAAVVLTSRNCPHKEGVENRNRLISRLVA